jgi:hypothetical protein
MKGKESRRETKKDKDSSKLKVQSDYQREKSRKGDALLDIKPKA